MNSSLQTSSAHSLTMDTISPASQVPSSLEADFKAKGPTLNTAVNGSSISSNYAHVKKSPGLRSNASAPVLTKIVNHKAPPPIHRSPSLPFVPLTTRDKVPTLFQEPHIETGFRELGMPWYSYVLSSFQLHNESMNVWTHFLALVLMAYKLWGFSSTVDFIHDPHSWPMLAGLVCGMLLYAFSAGAHCMQSKSEIFHYTAFMIDYSGIGLYGLGSVIVHIAYCSEDIFYNAVHGWFVPLGCLMAFAICFCCTISKVMYTRPYPFSRKIWQITPVVGIYILLISPIAHRLYYCFVHNADCNDSIPLHIQQIIWFILSGSFFASDFPQRLQSGLCDYFFHSHQLFHICIMICTLRQMDAVYIDFMTRKDVILSREVPTFFSAFGPVIITILSEFICIFLFRMRILKKLREKRKSQ